MVVSVLFMGDGGKRGGEGRYVPRRSSSRSLRGLM